MLKVLVIDRCEYCNDPCILVYIAQEKTKELQQEIVTAPVIDTQL